MEWPGQSWQGVTGWQHPVAGVVNNPREKQQPVNGIALLLDVAFDWTLGHD
jgi:hypothetical protein